MLLSFYFLFTIASQHFIPLIYCLCIHRYIQKRAYIRNSNNIIYKILPILSLDPYFLIILKKNTKVVNLLGLELMWFWYMKRYFFFLICRQTNLVCKMSYFFSVELYYSSSLRDRMHPLDTN